LARRAIVPGVPRPNAFSDAHLDRAAHRRNDAAWLQAAREGGDALAIVANAAAVAVSPAGTAVRLPLADAAALPGFGEPILVGVEDGVALFAVDGEGADLAALLGDRGSLAGLRDAALYMARDDAGLLAFASAILSWQRRHRFCGVCGTRTDSIEGGHARHCPNCGATNYPRTDPVIIVVVADPAEDRLLLGRQAVWPQGRYSALAGFVEPAESLEEAVAREVLEESGVTVSDVRYRSSQPWPFPGSLMLGFEATWVAGDPHPVDGELEDARWFGRAEIAAAAGEDVEWGEEDTSRLLLPPTAAIARTLIDGWLAGG
jgi:NAD+ diphosphatase